MAWMSAGLDPTFYDYMSMPLRAGKYPYLNDGLVNPLLLS